MTDDTPHISDDDLHRFMESLVASLPTGTQSEDEIQPTMRHWDKATTRMGDLPDDLTGPESLALFGTPYDSSTMRLRGILEMFAPDGRFEELLHHVQHVTDPVFHVEETDTIEEAMPKGIIIDLVTVGLLAHDILKNVQIEGGGIMKLGDLLNGKGPFDE
jgi:hypothetical protein